MLILLLGPICSVQPIHVINCTKSHFSLKSKIWCTTYWAWGYFHSKKKLYGSTEVLRRKVGETQMGESIKAL